jgi:1-aminocyclopropane-1-carboxylate deaminase
MIEFEKIILIPTPLIPVNDPLFEKNKVEVWIKRDDLTHPEVSGNKFRKLKYNLKEARRNDADHLITFGGAYSNHIFAVAAAGHYFNFKTTAFIRGDELTPFSSPTLRFASEKGMALRFVSREAYRNKDGLIKKSSNTEYLIPEGGSNRLALTGVAEMVDEILDKTEPDFICCAAGTGGTLAGILSNEKYKGKVLGIPVLKGGEFIRQEVSQLLGYDPGERLILKTEYHFGGYGKTKPELQVFIESMQHNHDVTLEYVYTGKLFYAVWELTRQGFFPEGSRIVIVHTGGLQKK